MLNGVYFWKCFGTYRNVKINNKQKETNNENPVNRNGDREKEKCIQNAYKSYCIDGKNVRDHFGIYDLPFENIFMLMCK